MAISRNQRRKNANARKAQANAKVIAKHKSYVAEQVREIVASNLSSPRERNYWAGINSMMAIGDKSPRFTGR